MMLTGQSVKPRDCRHSAYYHNDITTGKAVKRRPAMQKMQATMQQPVFDQHTHFKQNNLPSFAIGLPCAAITTFNSDNSELTSSPHVNVTSACLDIIGLHVRVITKTLGVV